MSAPFVDPTELLRITDDGSYERGRGYFQRGHVLRAIWSENGRELTALVRGSRGSPYRCSVSFHKDGDTIGSTRCSCPMQFGCKHVVAAVLASNAVDADDAAPSGEIPVSQIPAPSWRSLITSPPVEARTVPLALGFELRHRAARGMHQWAPRMIRTALPSDVETGEGELLLGIRPLMRSQATGAWIQGNVSWDTVRRSSGQHTRAQTRWFADLLSIARDSLLSGTAGDWLLLDQVESALLWAHLRAAADAGIPLISLQKGTTVALAEECSVVAGIDRAAEGDLTVTAVVSIDGRPVDPAAVRTIGHSGIYAATSPGGRVAVSLAELPLSPPVHALLQARATLTVPVDEEPVFLRDAYPVLARGVSVRPTGSVVLPPLPHPSATLALSFHHGDTVRYAFEWSYEGHGRFPFASGSEAVRDRAAEDRSRAEVERIWQETTGTAFAASGEFHDVEAAEFVTHIVPNLESQGVLVAVSGKRKSYRELSGEPEITVSTVESTDPDWFDLGVLVKIDGKTIPFTPLFTALAKGRKKLLLVDGSYFSLNHPALDQLRELLDEAAELSEWETGPRISRHQLALWEEFEDLADEAVPAVSWRATVDGLRAATGVPEAVVPAGLRAELRPYQRAGFEWLAFLWQHRLGGILADDMGLGKTLQLLTLVLHARAAGERRPFLVVAPTSVLATWHEEAARFAPDLRVHVRERTTGKQATSVATGAATADLVVTSYTLLRLNEDEFAAVEWAGVILDEAQFVKNAATRQHRAVAALKADVTFAVTGTPMENSLSELWALLKLAAPGLFPSARKFRQEYILPIEKGKVPENEEGAPYRQRRLERLRRRIRPLMLRRTKELVAADLPEKQEQLLHVELSPAHRAHYDVVLQRERQKVLGLLEDLDRNRFIVFRSLTMLRMLSLAPALIDDAHARIGSRKLDVLLERVVELQAEGHRALVFSQFTSYLSMAAERLDAAGIPYAYLDGSTRNRREVVDSFRAGEQPVFLISLKAGGFGLTLTEADYVFMLDPWWNPAAEAQAVDRTHRIGQTNPVMVYRMISSDTIEEKVLALQQRKARLFTAVMDDEALFAQALTADDIRGLFED